MCKISNAVEQVTEVILLFRFLLKGSSESEKEEKKRQVHCLKLSSVLTLFSRLNAGPR